MKHILKAAEKKHYADLLATNKSNIRKAWSVLKNIINTNKIKKIQERFRLSDESITSDKMTISSQFNNFFVNIGNNSLQILVVQISRR